MGKKIKELIIEKILEYGYIVTFVLLAELLAFFHPVAGTEGFFGLLFGNNGVESNFDSLNPGVKVFIFTMSFDLLILLFFNFRDAFRNRQITDPANVKETSEIFKLICFHVSAVLRCLILLVLLNLFDAKEFMDKFSVPFGISFVVGFSLWFISMGIRILMMPMPGGSKIQVVFKIIKGVMFLACSAIGLFVGGFVVMNLMTNNVAEEKSVESTASVKDTPVAITSDGIFVGTANENDFYLLPETFSGDKKSFKVTVEYIDKDENQKGKISFFFVHNPAGWIYYDSINESEKKYVSKLHDGDLVKKIWNYCMEVKLEDSLPITTQNEPPKKKPMYRYPGQHNNGIYVWAGYMNGLGCYLDTSSIHVFDNTSEYKDWEQVVRLYEEDRFVESVIQNFHWDPQNGACVGGRGISRITDKNLMYQFETGWRHAFGTEYR